MPALRRNGNPAAEAERHGRGAPPATLDRRLQPDLSRVVFESQQRLTADATASTEDELTNLYESDEGQLRLAGRMPANRTTEAECDDAPGAAVPPCVAAQVSVGGQGAGLSHAVSHTPGVVSDGSDGHERTFFTFPTNDDGTSLAADYYADYLYLREDGHRSVQINRPEREGAPVPFAPAKFFDASADGSRSFLTTQALTNDSPTQGQKIYMYEVEGDNDEQQRLTIAATYTLNFKCEETAPIAYDAAPAAVGAALEALTAIGPGGLAVSGRPRRRLRHRPLHDRLLGLAGRAGPARPLSGGRVARRRAAAQRARLAPRRASRTGRYTF